MGASTEYLDPLVDHACDGSRQQLVKRVRPLAAAVEHEVVAEDGRVLVQRHRHVPVHLRSVHAVQGKEVRVRQGDLFTLSLVISNVTNLGAYQATVHYSRTLMHPVTVTHPSPSFLTVSGRTEDGIIMSVRHKKFPIEGVQFHPESILSEEGKRLLKNFLEFY